MNIARRTRFRILILCWLVFCCIGYIFAYVSAGIKIGDEEFEVFYLAIGDYYKMPKNEVVVVKEWGILDEHIPVVMFLAARARVAPAVIIDLRLKGMA
jgi:hypothetical protein